MEDMDEFPPRPSKRNPVTKAAFRRQVWLQIYLPLAGGVLLLAAAAAGLWRADLAGASAWADASAILLLPPVLVVILIAEEPLYHSLQKTSFSAWVPRASVGETDYRPDDFGLGPEAEPMMTAMAALFRELGVQPTPSEFERLLHDIHHNVRTADELTCSIYGWTEGIDRTLLMSDRVQRHVRELMPVIEEYVGIEHVELTAAHTSSDD
jgi:hypothetical protein